MRRILTAALAVGALLAAAFVSPGAETLSGDPGPGYFATENVEWLGNLPINIDSPGARVHDGYFYITDDRGLTIYDLSEPTSPQPVGFHPLPQTPYIPEEDVDTNGEILLVGTLGSVFVLDVTDKSQPTLIGDVSGADEHTITCLLDCTWAYGSGGAIVELTDPTAPVLHPEPWWSGLAEDTGVSSSHDVTEVAPGIVVTSSNPVLMLDVRQDPLHPKVIATGDPGDGRFVHGNLWKNAGVDDLGLLVEPDDFLMVGGETSSTSCGPEDAALMAFDARALNDESAAIRGALEDGREAPARTAGFDLVGEWRVPGAGLYSDGNAPYNQFCAHWFTLHPTWEDGGLLTMAWYEHGVRFLHVASEADAAADPEVEFGEITELGWFVPVGGSTSAAYWITDEIVYTADYQRGIDILRFTDAPASDGQR